MYIISGDVVVDKVESGEVMRYDTFDLGRRFDLSMASHRLSIFIYYENAPDCDDGK